MLREISDLIQAAPSRPLVAFVGDTSRTWYDDQYMLMEVMGILRDANPEVVMVTGGQYPFDDYVERMSLRMNIDVFTHGAELDILERLAVRYDRPLKMLDGLSALIVFHRLSQPWTGLGQIVPEAMQRGVPVVAIDREGKSQEWVSMPPPRELSKVAKKRKKPRK